VQLKAGNVVRYETKSNISGLYILSDIQAGSYQLAGSNPGYQAWTENVIVKC
jgi:hypothetical protein